MAKLRRLLGHCDALEQCIRESRRLAGQLLQTALREAGTSGAVVAAEEAQERKRRPSRPPQYASGQLGFGERLTQ